MGQAAMHPWIVVSGGISQRGGMDKLNAALAKYLAEKQAPVHLVTHDVDPTLRIYENVRIHLVSKPLDSLALGESALKRTARMIARDLCKRSPKTRVVVNGGNFIWPDVNWVHCVHRAWPCQDTGAPIWFVAKNRITKAVARRREAIALRCARVVVANSEKTRRDLLVHLGLDAQLVHTVYPGADPDLKPVTLGERTAARAWLGKPADRLLVVFLGALGHDCNKGFDTLLRAWAVLCARSTWDVDLLAVGAGLGSDRWRSEIGRLGLGARINMLGFTDRIKEVFAAADLLVSPVRYEAYGLNVQEAFCRGVPAVVSASAGVAERYPERLQDLLIREPEHVEELVAKLLNWRQNPDRWKEWVLPFGRELRRHTLWEMAAQIVSLVERTPLPLSSALRGQQPYGASVLDSYT